MMYAKMIAVAACLMAFAAVTATAEDKKDGKKADAKPLWTGTIKVEGKKPKFALAEMAKVPMPDAVKAALGAVKAGDADKRVVEVELDAAEGYLVWEVEVAVRNQDGITKVIVDAGSGKVLAIEVEKEEDAKDKQGK